MGMLTMLKEGGSLLIDTIGNLPISEDLDLLVTAGGTLSVTFRIVMDSFFITSSNSSQAYAIVMGD
jgi:hypothetical protein